MPSSWHSHREGLGREGGCDFSLWQRAEDWMGRQASSRSTGHSILGMGITFWSEPGNSVKFFYHSSQSFRSFRSLTWALGAWGVSPELATSLSLGTTRISLFPKGSCWVFKHQATVAWFLDPIPNYEKSIFLHITTWASHWPQGETKDHCKSFHPRHSFIQVWLLG